MSWNSAAFDEPSSIDPAVFADVAELRFGDAKVLRETGRDVHANGVAYLAGLVIEILLKARLLKQYPHLIQSQTDQLSPEQNKIYRLIWVNHNLKTMLIELPQVVDGLEARDRRFGSDVARDLKKFCAA